jgi:hypothetical protein
MLPAALEVEFRAAEAQLYSLAAWLVSAAARLKAHLAGCLQYAWQAADARGTPLGLLEPFPLEALVGGIWVAAARGAVAVAGGADIEHSGVSQQQGT